MENMTNEQYKKIRPFLKSDAPKVVGNNILRNTFPLQRCITLQDSGFEFKVFFNLHTDELLNFLETKRPGEKGLL